MSTPIRVRFAPSPTGTLHLGSARSALYNWLVARHAGEAGTYVLRIEDTDQERSTPENVDQALRVFRWLGLEWNEGPEVGGPYGPYFQSQRGSSYAEVLQAWLEPGGPAYPCFCTKEQLTADRAEADAAKRPFTYTGRCRSIPAGQADARREAGEAHVIRFRVPDDGDTLVDDYVLGETRFENALLGDFVIARADGTPLYNFANVIDDSAMRITHVIRGNDHLSNTPRQVLMYEALGVQVPQFAHLPMVLGPDGAKLSKRRHHTATIEQLAEAGYAPAAVRNGLALVGWSKDDVTNVMSTEELIESFSLQRVKKSSAAIDYDKLQWLNAEHLRAMSAEEWAAGYEAWRAEWLAEDDPRHGAAHVASGELAHALVHEKVTAWGEVPAMVAFLADPFEMHDAAWTRLEKTGDVGVTVLERATRMVEQLEEWTLDSLEAGLIGITEELELGKGKVFAPIRFAVTGQTITPGLWESMHALGRDRVVDRLRAGGERLAAAMQPA